MSNRPTLPPGFTPDGYPEGRRWGDRPPLFPMTVLTVPELLDRAAHIAVEHPDALVGLALIFEDDPDDDPET